MTPEMWQEVSQQLGEQLVNQIPFNQHIGLTYQEITPEDCRLEFEMKPELVGNYMRGILHGGVISSALDMVGGVMAAVGILKSNVDHEQELMHRLVNLSTIDMRVDFLRTGKGKRFIAKARLLRHGKRVAVSRMELVNEEGREIAVGTATYMVG